MIVEQTKKKDRKQYRYLLLLVLIISVLGMMWYMPVQPPIHLAVDSLTPTISILGIEFGLANTILAVFVADILILLVAWSINRQLKSGKEVLTGIGGIVAMILEFLWSMTKSTAGKWAKLIFPWFATIFLIVLFVNWMELIPGVDSVGIMHKLTEEEIAEGEHAYEAEAVLGQSWLMTITGEAEHHEEGMEAAEAEGEEHAEAEHHDQYKLIPFIRVASTDLNFTVGLALISVVATQFVGLKTLGGEYLLKYWNPGKMVKYWKKPRLGNPLEFVLGVVDFLVGLLEILAEFSKIISFAFRLFGVIFAGSVMLFVIGSLIPVFVQSVFVLLELFFGALQAFVFGMLTMMFMSLATHSHAHGEEEHH